MIWDHPCALIPREHFCQSFQSPNPLHKPVGGRVISVMPRRKAWNGQKPETPEEARRYLMEIARETVEEIGLARATLADVAERAGVTRQTVYRYFEDTDDLFRSAAALSAGGLLTRMVERVRSVAGWPERLIEGTVFVVREIPKDPNLGSLLDEAGGIDLKMLAKLDIARQTAAAFAEGDVPLPPKELEELTELMLRLVESFLRTAPDDARTDEELRGFLLRWIAPAIRDRMQKSKR